jgi:hypothetical protein
MGDGEKTPIGGRLVHHSIILEFDVPSYRTGAAELRHRDTDLSLQIQEVNRP